MAEDEATVMRATIGQERAFVACPMLLRSRQKAHPNKLSKMDVLFYWKEVGRILFCQHLKKAKEKFRLILAYIINELEREGEDDAAYA